MNFSKIEDQKNKRESRLQFYQDRLKKRVEDRVNKMSSESLKERMRGIIEERRYEKRNKIAELFNPIENLLVELRHEINDGKYDTIIGEDVSGRIPALIFGRVIKNIYDLKNYPLPQSLFFAGSGGGLESKRETEEKITKIMETVINSRKGKNAESKVLIVTEYIETGLSLQLLIDALERAGIDFDIATLYVRSNMIENLQKRFKGKIHYSNLTLGPPKIFNYKSFSGVSKKSKDVFSEPLKKTDPKKYSSSDILDARDYAMILAESLTSRYENRFLKNNA